MLKKFPFLHKDEYYWQDSKKIALNGKFKAIFLSSYS